MFSISLIIPCYRDSLTLKAALDSVYAQTVQVDEVIVVNDCSPETQEIEQILKDYPAIRYIRNDTNIGLAATRNAGAKAANGEILVFLDADDELHSQKIELQLEVFKPDIAVTCQVKRIRVLYSFLQATKYFGSIPIKKFSSSRSVIWRNSLTGASMMISKKLFLQNQGYDQSLRSCEDFDFWLRLLDSGVQVINIRLPLYLYRINPVGLSMNYDAISAWELKVVESHIRRHKFEFMKGGLSEAILWASWVLKHIYRFELSKDKSLELQVLHSINMLRPNNYFLYVFMMCINKSHVLVLLVKANNFKKILMSENA